jgi:hypothetical protein
MKFSATSNALASQAAAPRLPHLADHPALAEVRAKIESFQARLAQAEARRQRARAANTAREGSSRNAVARAEMLAAGGHIPSAEPRAELRAAEDETTILRQGLAKLADDKAEIESRLNFEACVPFQPAHVAALRRIDGFLAEIHAALAELHAIDASLRAAGYCPTAIVLPANVPRALYTLGDPETPVGQAHQFRQWLKKTFGDRP